MLTLPGYDHDAHLAEVATNYRLARIEHKKSPEPKDVVERYVPFEQGYRVYVDGEHIGTMYEPQFAKTLMVVT